MLSKDQMKVKKREMVKQLNRQTRQLDRAIYDLERTKRQTQEKLKKEIAKGEKADTFTKKTYARQMLQCTKKIDQTNINKAKIKGMEYQIDAFMANMTLAQAMGQAGNLMAQINKTFNIQDVTAATQKFAEGMMKMEITQEMLDDVMDTGNQDIDIDAEAEKMLQEMQFNVQMGIKNPATQKPVAQTEDNKLFEEFEKKMANY